MAEWKKVGTISFDYWANPREDGFDDSCSGETTICNLSGDLEIEDYWRACRYFAGMIGFAEATIEEWFGTC